MHEYVTLVTIVIFAVSIGYMLGFQRGHSVGYLEGRKEEQLLYPKGRP